MKLKALLLAVIACHCGIAMGHTAEVAIDGYTLDSQKRSEDFLGFRQSKIWSESNVELMRFVKTSPGLGAETVVDLDSQGRIYRVEGSVLSSGGDIITRGDSKEKVYRLLGLPDSEEKEFWDFSSLTQGSQGTEDLVKDFDGPPDRVHTLTIASYHRIGLLLKFDHSRSKDILRSAVVEKGL